MDWHFEFFLIYYFGWDTAKHLTINQYFVVTLGDPKGYEFQKNSKTCVCSFVCLFGFYVPLEIKIYEKSIHMIWIFYKRFHSILFDLIFWKLNLFKFLHTVQSFSAKIMINLIFIFGSMIETFCHRCLCYLFSFFFWCYDFSKNVCIDFYWFD